MSEPDPFASPFHPVHLPGEPSGPVPAGYGYPAPMPAAQPGPLAQRPVTTTASFWSWIAGALLTVLVLPGLYYLRLDLLGADLHAESQLDPTPLTRAEADLLAAFLPLIYGAGLAVASVPFVVAAFKIRSGRNWARVTLAVLGGVAIVFGLLMLGLFASGTITYVPWLVGVAWSLAFLASVLLGIVAMFLPASNAYVRSVYPR
ncbi:MFS family permease [Saccharothrix coeruleofusca]|uniref:hypothetical protein n=1 Tax=Saccharothrix coeruleofusca TaxID=33919 RepID=UPI001AE92465|nr:hypothetical protein [Saccharothrix coeruleofusca]MBP2339516.1 MFS family permease [Saccharothrix coeruleofusca]